MRPADLLALRGYPGSQGDRGDDGINGLDGIFIFMYLLFNLHRHVKAHKSETHFL